VAFRLIQVAKAPANKAFLRKVRNVWHQACQNFATDRRPQAISPGEVVSALGQMKLGTNVKDMTLSVGFQCKHPPHISLSSMLLSHRILLSSVG